MVINDKKHKFTIISCKSIGLIYDENINVMINGIWLEQVTEMKYLGAVIHKNPNMHCRVQNFVTKMSKPGVGKNVNYKSIMEYLSNFVWHCFV